MDKIYGWEDEEKCVGSQFAACMWIYIRGVLTGWQKPTPEIQEYLERRLLSIMLCMNWVCAGTFDDYEWVSESTIAMQEEEEVMGRQLDYENCVHCVVRWCMLWVSAPTGLNQIMENQGIKIAKYHEAVNMAIAYAISAPL